MAQWDHLTALSQECLEALLANLEPKDWAALLCCCRHVTEHSHLAYKDHWDHPDLLKGTSGPQLNQSCTANSMSLLVMLYLSTISSGTVHSMQLCHQADCSSMQGASQQHGRCPETCPSEAMHPHLPCQMPEARFSVCWYAAAAACVATDSRAPVRTAKPPYVSLVVTVKGL
jgi:hypothetical protein